MHPRDTRHPLFAPFPLTVAAVATLLVAATYALAALQL